MHEETIQQQRITCPGFILPSSSVWEYLCIAWKNKNRILKLYFVFHRILCIVIERTTKPIWAFARIQQSLTLKKSPRSFLSCHFHSRSFLFFLEERKKRDHPVDFVQPSENIYNIQMQTCTLSLSFFLSLWQFSRASRNMRETASAERTISVLSWALVCI